MDFYSFSVSLNKAILKNDKVQIFLALGDILLLWKPSHQD